VNFEVDWLLWIGFFVNGQIFGKSDGSRTGTVCLSGCHEAETGVQATQGDVESKS